MRTTVYIDGFNLYYGRLKHTKYKWLDLNQLATQIIRVQTPQAQIQSIKYFTADIKATFSTHGQQANDSQQRYHRALEICCNGIEIIKGHHTTEPVTKPRYQDGQPLNKADKIKVWHMEEKQTDVNIALHMYHDVLTSTCDQVILISNDTDLVPVLKMIRENRGDLIDIGVITPIKPPKKDQKQRPASGSLRELADWMRSYISDDELLSSQLPDQIPTRRKPIKKPDYDALTILGFCPLTRVNY